MPDLLSAVESVLREQCGTDVRVRGRSALAGGSINATERVHTSAGTFVLKSNAAAPDRLFAAEAAGLTALRESGTSLAIPRVIAVGTTPCPFLLIEYLEPAPRTATFDERLGVGLAELHRATADRFGFTEDNFCGATPQPNPWTARWLEFYAESRLRYQVRLAREGGLMSRDIAARFDRLIDRLDRWLSEPAEGPALVHGDLWSGNLHVAPDGGPALIDPAAYFGHREAEFGMMLWFGGFSPRVFEHYAAAFPLEAGWRERQPLYRLYHVLNHANLFGHGYLEDAVSLVRRFA